MQKWKTERKQNEQPRNDIGFRGKQEEIKKKDSQISRRTLRR
jgi:hypothetical protein